MGDMFFVRERAKHTQYCCVFLRGKLCRGSKPGALLLADVLSDPTARSLYDRYGPEEMREKAGANSGRGNAREV